MDQLIRGTQYNLFIILSMNQLIRGNPTQSICYIVYAPAYKTSPQYNLFVILSMNQLIRGNPTQSICYVLYDPYNKETLNTIYL